MNSPSQRLSNLQFVTLAQPQHMQFRHWAKLYHSRFPYQELAPLTSISKSIIKRESCLQGLTDKQGGWAAFTLCEFYNSATLLAYLATAESYEGQGLAKIMVQRAVATHLCKDQSFFWLEANPKLWKFYHKLGFKRLDIDYRIPEFYADGTEKMGLFVKTHAPMAKVNKAVVANFVSELLLSGYDLSEADPRYQQQMSVIQTYPQSTITLLSF